MSIASEIEQALSARSAAIAANDVDRVMAQIADDIVSFDVGAP